MRTTIGFRSVAFLACLGLWGCGAEPGGSLDSTDTSTSELTVLPTVNPRWKVLVLVPQGIDFTYVDSNGRQRHVVSQVQSAELSRVQAAAQKFFNQDVPILTSGNHQPTVTVRSVAKLTSLSQDGDGWTAGPDDTRANLDPSFDSVITVWDSSVTDQNSGEQLNLAYSGGLTWFMGLSQTYTSLPLDNVSSTNQNLFKHEWGHAVLFYHEAAGIAPNPAVDNHINDTTTRYVNCLNGGSYILMDEDSVPVRNSIYNNEVGFTHDYMSGRTATPDQPRRCLGITPAAWLSGGPVTRPNPTGGLTTAVTFSTEWTTGYCADLVVTNTSSKPIDWGVRIPVSGTIYNLWNGVYSQSGNQLSVAGTSWNRTLAPGQSTMSVGFCANRS